MVHVALTFDDGPDGRWTPAVLDALRAVGAKATFFVLGECARRHPDAVRRAVTEGHAVQVHGDGHVRHTELTRGAAEEDLDRALEALDALGIRPSRWRTPWGVEAEWTRDVAAERDLALVGWTIDTHDWRGDAAEAMLAAVGPELRAGAVVLLHDGLGPGARRQGCEETVRFTRMMAAESVAT